MKSKNIVAITLLFLLLLSACGSQKTEEQKQIEVQVAVSLTQTAAVPAPEPTSAAPANGTITGKVSLSAPPTPAMTIYAVDPATGNWFSAEAPANDTGASDFTLSVPPGTYQVFSGNAAAYSTDGMGLSLVTVQSNQTVSNINVQFIGQGDCGFNIAIPASPDGKYQAVPGPDQACLANQQAESQPDPTMAPPMRIDVLPGGSWSITGIMQPNTHPSFIFAGDKDKVLTVTVKLDPNAGAAAYINSAGGMIMATNITSTGTITMPAKVDYVVGIDNNTQQDVSYTLTITITKP